MPARLTVVISQGQSQNPVRRQLEEDVVAQLIMEPGTDVVVVPNLYDLTPESTGLLALQSISGPMVVCAWLFPRAAHWILDRQHISGIVGTTLLVAADDSDDDEEEEDREFDPQEAADAKPRVVDQRPRAARSIYCLDLRVSPRAEDFVAEIRRIRQENSLQFVGLGLGLGSANGNGHPRQPTSDQLARYAQPTNDTPLPLGDARSASSSWLHPSVRDNGESHGGGGASMPTPVAGADSSSNAPGDDAPGTVQRIEATAERRWYPVIDYSRCTNCMECIDFCLFGVYGVDKLETILVEQADNCRKGCPACSRVCPENAIMFPQHKTPAIAGSPEVGASLKIDLSELFGAPEQNKSAAEVAIAERDEQLVMAGRAAVGDSGGNNRAEDSAPRDKDELDRLIDQLDAFDL